MDISAHSPITPPPWPISQKQQQDEGGGTPQFKVDISALQLPDSEEQLTNTGVNLDFTGAAPIGFTSGSAANKTPVGQDNKGYEQKAERGDNFDLTTIVPAGFTFGSEANETSGQNSERAAPTTTTEDVNQLRTIRPSVLALPPHLQQISLREYER
jgi:hypothetical protein